MGFAIPSASRVTDRMRLPRIFCEFFWIYIDCTLRLARHLSLIRCQVPAIPERETSLTAAIGTRAGIKDKIQYKEGKEIFLSWATEKEVLGLTYETPPLL